MSSLPAISPRAADQTATKPQTQAKDMVAVIRTTPGRLKYCGGTVDALIASNDPDEHTIIIQCSNKSPNENGLAALQKGINASNGRPFIFLEDDVRFIRRFTRAAQDFTNACMGLYSPILPLGANYTVALDKCRGIAWRYRPAAFYGTQAFVIRPADAEDFIKWCRKQELPPAGFDILIKRWAEEKRIAFFLTPRRSFVQHIGVESSLHNGSFFHFATWPGAQWEYRTGAFSLEEQRNRPCDKGFVKAAAAWLGAERVVYDYGCSTGNYLKEFKTLGLMAHGFDATPGLQSDEIDELDLARPQVFSEPAGNVISMGVAEHIHAEDETHFLDNLCSLCADKLIICWGLKGQGGRRHVNEQNAPYVIEKFVNRGFIQQPDVEATLREASTLEWFRNSTYVFRRQQKA